MGTDLGPEYRLYSYMEPVCQEFFNNVVVPTLRESDLVKSVDLNVANLSLTIIPTSQGLFRPYGIGAQTLNPHPHPLR